MRNMGDRTINTQGRQGEGCRPAVATRVVQQAVGRLELNILGGADKACEWGKDPKDNVNRVLGVIFGA
jgi:hypothetical protein